MGQDSEQAAEFVATVRAEHVAMKTWYNAGDSTACKDLQAKYGPYPALWKEVLNWPGWKEARKEYLKQKEVGDTLSAEGKNANPAPFPRKRKSRWGSATDTSTTPTSNNSNDDSSAKRRSRWGGGGGTTTTANVPPVHPPTNAPPLPGMVLPTQLPQDKQKEMRELQTRLREINVKLENLEKEAARVDALPRGHRERSPSPPPGKSTVQSYCAVSSCYSCVLHNH